MVDTADSIFRDFVSDGIPASGIHEPSKPKIREWGAWIEQTINAGLSGSGTVYTLRSNLFANLNYPANTSAWVIGDPTPAFNGIYAKQGASGAGSWVKVSDLPFSFIKATDSGAGTANAIQATTTIPVGGAFSTLILMNVFENNTGPTTVSINGATAKPLVTNSGGALGPNYLTAGMLAAYVDDGTSYRLISDVASASIQAAAEAAAASASADKDDAEAAAAAAAASAATINLPALSGPSDAGKQLYVNAGGTGYDLAVASGMTLVATRTALKALDTTAVKIACLTEAGREGIFLWRTGNFASLITADAAEGLYVKATAVASTAGSWVRLRPNLDAEIGWFGAVTGAAAGANAAANDAAYASALALSNVMRIRFAAGIYEFSTTISINRSGLELQGYSSHPVFGSGGGTGGTLIRWTGSAGGVMIFIKDAGTGDINNPKIFSMELDGNLLAGVGVDIQYAQWPHLENMAIRNMRNSGSPICLRMGMTTGGAGTGVNCVYRGTFRNLILSSLGSGVPLYITGTGGIGNTTFCVFDQLHLQHENGAGIFINGADDCEFRNCGTNRIAGGTGRGLNIDGISGSWVVGNTWYQFHCGTADGTVDIQSTGAMARQNKIYGLSGVDDAPTIDINTGSQLFYEFLGTGYSSDATTENSKQLSPPMKVPNFHVTNDDVLDFFKERNANLGMTFGGAAVGMTLASAFYRSVRVGGAVMYKMQIQFSAKGSSSGAAIITGFPYSLTDGSPCAVYATNMTSGVGDTMLIAQMTSTGTVALYKMSAGAITALTAADFTNTTLLVLTGIAFTDTTSFA